MMSQLSLIRNRGCEVFSNERLHEAAPRYLHWAEEIKDSVCSWITVLLMSVDSKPKCSICRHMILVSDLVFKEHFQKDGEHGWHTKHTCIDKKRVSVSQLVFFLLFWIEKRRKRRMNTNESHRVSATCQLTTSQHLLTAANLTKSL